MVHLEAKALSLLDRLLPDQYDKPGFRLPWRFEGVAVMDISLAHTALDRIRSGLTAEDVESETLEIKPWPGKTVNGRFLVDRERLSGWLREYAVCFANAGGGLLLFGVREGSRGPAAIVGCQSYDLEEVKRMVFEGTIPGIIVDVEELRVPEGVILCVRVPKSPSVHATSSGRRLRRVGKTCRVLTPEEDIIVEVERGGDYSAKFLRGVGMEAVDPVEVDRLRNWLRRYRPGSDLVDLANEDLLRALEICREHEEILRPTVAALLLVGREESLREHLPQNEVIFNRFEEDVEPVQTVLLKRPLLYVLDRLRELMEPFNSVFLLKGDFLEVPIPSYPDEVVREALLNALVHRSYVDPEAVNVRLYPHHLEIGSPGGFIGGITPDNILTHEPKRRNRLLAEVFQKIGAVNRSGIGVDRMYRILLEYGKRPPEYVADGESVVVLLRNGTFDEPFARFVAVRAKEGYRWRLADLIVLSHLRDNETIEAQTAARLLQRPVAAASEVLRTMEGAFLEKFGVGRGTYYRLNSALYEALGAGTRYVRDRGIDLSRQRELVKQYVAEHGEIDNATCRDLCGLNRNQARRLLQLLVEEGYLRSIGERRWVRYIQAGRQDA